MENMIKTFVNEEFGTVRTLLKDGQPWFVGKGCSGNSWL